MGNNNNGTIKINRWYERRCVMQNTDIKKKMKLEHICSWEVAEKLNIHESTFCKWFRKPLRKDQEIQVLSALEDILLTRVKEPKEK